MIKLISRLLPLLILCNLSLIQAQQRNLWSGIDEAKIRNSQFQRKIAVKNYEGVVLQTEAFKGALQLAPAPGSQLQYSEFILEFPTPDGRREAFRIKESPVMHPLLAKEYTDNRSYKGVAVNDPSRRIYFSVNQAGLHAVMLGGDRPSFLIDPIDLGANIYKVYRKSAQINEAFECKLQGSIVGQQKTAKKQVDDGVLRKYRLAVAATGEYSQFHIDDQGLGGGTETEQKGAVMAAITTAVTRVNAVFENDLAITMEIVPDNSDIVYLDGSTDPYTNDDGPAMLTENQNNLDLVIGNDEYDIGHVFSTGGGGIASLASSCITGSKAKGVTGSEYPKGDSFYFDFVAHELGHQFGANHTFNGNESNCNGNENSATSVEPGSGSSLMAYAGLCGSQNIQSAADLYFHAVSVQEIWSHVNGLQANCPTKIPLDNNLNAPTADAGEDFIVPVGTAFVLKGEGEDLDGDILTYNWEQMDPGMTAVPPNGNSVNGPLYRSLEPSISSNRYLPGLSTLTNGQISSQWEVTPLVARSLNFRLTVRDNHIEGGQTATDDLVVTVTDQAGPFVVTSQNADDLVWTPGATEIVSWDVAGTDANGIGATTVNIYLSTDGGRTFDIPLAINTPNDGTQAINVPDDKASSCFIMVEAVSQHFFALNQKRFSIGNFNQVCRVVESTDVPKAIPDNDVNGVVSVLTVDEDITIESIKLRLLDPNPNPDPNRSDIEQADPGIEHTWIGDLAISLSSPSGTTVEIYSNNCVDEDNIQAIFSDEGGSLVCDTPLMGEFEPINALNSFKNENAQGEWKLKVVDSGDRDEGNVLAWSLEICTFEPVLSVNNHVFENFNIFPNPSQGVFTITFKRKDPSDVEITLFDVLGRAVSNQTFKTPGLQFREVIDVSDISGGIYIVRVKSGNQVSSQRLRIK